MLNAYGINVLSRDITFISHIVIIWLHWVGIDAVAINFEVESNGFKHIDVRLINHFDIVYLHIVPSNVHACFGINASTATRT